MTMPHSLAAARFGHPGKARPLALTRAAAESKFATLIAVSEGRSGFFFVGGECARTILGAVAEWLRSGLQSRVHRFDSGPRLQVHPA